MKERPILFSTPMVKAIMEDRKTVTRRTNGINTIEGVNGMKVMTFPKTGKTETFVDAKFTTFGIPVESGLIKCPYGNVGDVLWVRETWAYVDFAGEDSGYVYRATDPDWDTLDEWRWKPSIFMPRAACRIRLEITSIRVERLHEITEEDAVKEGIKFDDDSGYWFAGYATMATTARECFRKLWVTINGKESWDANPWGWRIEFCKLS